MFLILPGAMEFSVEEQRVIVKFFTAAGRCAADIHRQLQAVCGDSALAENTVRKWVREFKGGRTSVKDEQRPGRPKTASTDANIARVEKFIMDDRRVTMQEICETLRLTMGTVERIITKELRLRKVSSRWVPRMLNDDQKDARVRSSVANLTRFRREGRNFLERIVTMDETHIPLFNPETKRQSMQWKHTDSPPPKNNFVRWHPMRRCYTQYSGIPRE